MSCNVESRLSTPCKNEAASAHFCDDESKDNDRRDDRHRASRSCVGAAVTERGGAFSGLWTSNLA